MKFFAGFLLGLLLTGCVSLTPEEKSACAAAEEGAAACEANLIEKKKEDRQYAIDEANAEHYDRYIQDKIACEHAGGYILVERKGTARICRGRDPCPPRWGDSYYCTR